MKSAGIPALINSGRARAYTERKYFEPGLAEFKMLRPKNL